MLLFYERVFWEMLRLTNLLTNSFPPVPVCNIFEGVIGEVVTRYK